MSTIELISAATDCHGQGATPGGIDLLAAGSRLREAPTRRRCAASAAGLALSRWTRSSCRERWAEREADILEGLFCHAVETWIAASGGGSGRQYDALRVLLNSIPGVCYCHACCSARGEADSTARGARQRTTPGGGGSQKASGLPTGTGGSATNAKSYHWGFFRRNIAAENRAWPADKVE